MKENKNNSGPVLAIYDVRGIQKYIFATNKIKEIVGASAIVENIITDALKEAVKQIAGKDTQKEYLVDWENEQNNAADAFEKNDKICMQVLFIGGGNAYVLYRDAGQCAEINRFMAKYVLEKTYSLNLAVAVVPKTDNYKNDYNAVNAKLIRIKAKMQEARPLGAQPFMKADSETGYPLSVRGTNELLCTERYLKQKKFDDKEEDGEKILDNMVTEKGTSSILAVVHIDGNSMGSRIMEIMSGKTEYKDAVRTMRSISENIKNTFNEAFKNACETIDGLSEEIKPGSRHKLYRKIVLAGDDITFICNAKAALAATEAFLQHIMKKELYTPDGAAADHGKYGFSACAGIAYFNSHFPFSDAYMAAEACCDNAKKTAKKKENRAGKEADGKIGSYVDFQICGHIKAADLEEYRRQNYTAPGLGSLLFRPYYIPFGNENEALDTQSDNRAHSINILWENLRYFQTRTNRSHAKNLRNAISKGKDSGESYMSFLKSRSIYLPGEEGENTDKESGKKRNWAALYDALEIMDICALPQKYRENSKPAQAAVHLKTIQ